MAFIYAMNTGKYLFHKSLAIIKQKLNTRYSTYEILQILGASLLDQTQLNQLLQKNNNQDVKELLYNQLKSFSLNGHY